jgi:hypothetical protein
MKFKHFSGPQLFSVLKKQVKLERLAGSGNESYNDVRNAAC